MERAIDWAGCWLGVATCGPSVFRYHWCLEQNGNEITGTISLSMEDGSMAGSYRMRGRASGNQLFFEGTEFIHNSSCWCMAAGILHHNITTDGLAELTGSWGPMRGFVWVDAEGHDLQSQLGQWIDLALEYNPRAKSSKKPVSPADKQKQSKRKK